MARGPVFSADLETVFVEGDVAEIQCSGFLWSSGRGPLGELICGCLLGGQAGDGVDHFGPSILAGEPSSLAGDLDSLAGRVGTRSRPRQYYLDDALFHPAVSTTAGGVRSWDLCPGQVFSWLCRGGLVAFLCEHVVGATPQHEIVGMAFLRAKRPL